LKGRNVGSDKNVLIVEDEDEWRKIYERAVSSQQPDQTIKVAKDLTAAKLLIDSTKFAVAFVDVGLDISDDHNVDGLRVMQKIRDTGDETSIVVVTGRSGQDVLPIARDAIKKYGAFDTIGKGSAGPSDIRRLLTGGLEAYRNSMASHVTDARNSIRATADPMIWDRRVTDAIDFRGNIKDFYGFLDQLFGDYLPLVNRLGSENVQIDSQNKIVYGNYWSRAVGEGLLIYFGAADVFDKSIEAVSADPSVLKNISGNSVPVRELATHGIRGAVFIMEGSRRDEFQLG
jgi:ActR/RegA family two-component response regulator